MTKKNIRILTWLNFFSEFKLYAPVAIIYFVSVSQSMTLGMSIFSLAMISSSLFELPTGIVSDMIGRKKTIIFGTYCALNCVVFYAIGQFYFFLERGAIFEGLSRAFFSGNNDAFLYDNVLDKSDSSSFQEYLGKIRSYLYFPLSFAGIIGSVLADISFSWLMWLSVLPMLICFVISFLLVETRKNEKTEDYIIHIKESFKMFFVNKRLRDLTLINTINYSLSESAFQFRNIFINQLWPLWSIGFISMLSNFGASIGFWFSGKILKKIAPLKTMFICGLYSRIANIFALLLQNVFSPFFMVTTSFFYGPSQVAMDSLLQNQYSNKHRATMGSITSLFGSILFSIISIGVGSIGDYWGSTNALLFLQLALIPIVLLNWMLFVNNRQKSTEVS
jgi:MFS family permease